eukprot:5451787-Alexandrium_andersonii.AAC.1
MWSWAAPCGTFLSNLDPSSRRLAAGRSSRGSRRAKWPRVVRSSGRPSRSALRCSFTRTNARERPSARWTLGESPASSPGTP